LFHQLYYKHDLLFEGRPSNLALDMKLTMGINSLTWRLNPRRKAYLRLKLHIFSL